MDPIHVKGDPNERPDHGGGNGNGSGPSAKVSPWNEPENLALGLAVENYIYISQNAGLNLDDIYKSTTQAGEDAAEWYAEKYIKTGNPFYALGGILASLWTTETAPKTSIILGSALTLNYALVKNASKFAHYPHARAHRTPHLQFGNKRIDVPKGIIDAFRKDMMKHFLK